MGQPFTLNDTQKELVSVSFKDAHGDPATAPAVPTWSTSDAAVATVAEDTTDPSHLSAFVSAVGPGSATITCTVSPEGGTTLTDSTVVTVVAGPAASVEIDASGNPIPK